MHLGECSKSANTVVVCYFQQLHSVPLDEYSIFYFTSSYDKPLRHFQIFAIRRKFCQGYPYPFVLGDICTNIYMTISRRGIDGSKGIYILNFFIAINQIMHFLKQINPLTVTQYYMRSSFSTTWPKQTFIEPVYLYSFD